MAINQNHLFEELNGVKCAIVEKNVAPARVAFLRGILEFNGFTVVVVASPPPKAAVGAGAAGPAKVPAGAGAAGGGVVGGSGAGGAAEGAKAGMGEGIAGTAEVKGADAGVKASAGEGNSAKAEEVKVENAGSAGSVGSVVPVAVAAAAPETFTVGVTDVMFNPTNAIFGRLLKAPGGHVVTLAFWKQQEAAPDDERPYFAGK